MIPFIGKDYFLAVRVSLIVIIGQHFLLVVLLDPADAVIKPKQIGVKLVDDLFCFGEPSVQEFLVGPALQLALQLPIGVYFSPGGNLVGPFLVM